MRKRDLVLAGIMALFVLFFAMVMVSGLGDGFGDGMGGFSEKVALIEVTGTIESPAWTVKQLRHYAEQDNVQAVVIRLDSPGGGVAASQEIYEEIGKLRDQGKKVVASFGSVAASGAYYVACAVDTVVANPGSLTGSIGVIFQFPIYENLLDKVGIRLETVKSGEFKDVGNPSRSITPREEEMLQAVIDNTYDQFVDVIAEARGMDREQVLEFATGAIFTGEQALDLGLVDVLGDYQDAIDIAGEMSGIGSDPLTVKQVRRRPFRLVDFLGEAFGVQATMESITGPRLAYLFTF